MSFGGGVLLPDHQPAPSNPRSRSFGAAYKAGLDPSFPRAQAALRRPDQLSLRAPLSMGPTISR